MALDVSAVIAEFGAYYIKGGQGEKNLFQQIYRGGEFDTAFTPIIQTDTLYRNATSGSTEMLQAFQKGFTPKGDVEFKPAPIHLDHIKADATFYPDDIEATYLGFLAGSGLDRKEWPIARWIAEKVLVAQFFEDIDTYAFTGVASTPTPGVAGPASTALNGFKKYLLDAIDGGIIPNANVLSIGAVPADPEEFVDYVEAVVESIPDFLRSRLALGVHMNHELVLRYIKGMRMKYNANYLQETDLLRLANSRNVIVKGFQAMSGESSMFISTKPNLLSPMKRPTQAVYMESSMREVKVSTDHWRGYGFADGRYIWVTDNILPEEEEGG